MHAPVAPAIPSKLLLQAYRVGVFPMADDREDADIFWVEPRERAIMPLDGFHCSRSLRKVLRHDRFAVTCNTAFNEVVERCAAPRPDQPTSWISRRIQASYLALHRGGHAHSVECWQDGALSGGLYGVAFDRVFCGESMFSAATDASKVALAWLVAAMRRAGYQVLDCQFMTSHLGSLGARTLSQAEYRALLVKARSRPLCSIPEAVNALHAEGARAAAGLSSAGDEPSSPGKLIAQFFTHTS